MDRARPIAMPRRVYSLTGISPFPKNSTDTVAPRLKISKTPFFWEIDPRTPRRAAGCQVKPRRGSHTPFQIADWMITLPTKARGGDLVLCDKVSSLRLGVSPGECSGALPMGHQRPQGDTPISEAVHPLNLFQVDTYFYSWSTLNVQ